MKKLLSILSSVAIAATATTTVVSCTVPKTNIDVTFIGDKGDDKSHGFTYDASTQQYTFGDATYTKDQLDTAMNGNYAMMNQQFPVAMSFDELNQSLLNLISFNQSLVVKTQKNQAQLRNFRDTFLGRDQNTVDGDGADTASVDGIKFKNIDDNNYYGAFQKTDINSLTGLLDLYNYANDANNKLKVMGASASTTVQEANDLFKDPNSAASELMRNFANSKKNPAFTKITYDLPLTVYQSQSQYIQGFASNMKVGNGDLKLGKINDYWKNNVDIAKETSVDVKNAKGKTTSSTNASNRINDHANTNPFAAIIVKPDTFDNGRIDNALDNGVLTEAKRTSTDASDSVLREFFTKDPDETNDSKDAKVYYYIQDDGSGNASLSQNIGEYMVKKVPDMKVSYEYQTDMEHNKTTPKSDSQKFDISFSIKNLGEVFSPYMTSVTGTSLSSATKDGSNTKLTFSKAVTADDFDGAITVTGDGSPSATINSDGTVTVNTTNPFSISFKDKNKDNGAAADSLNYKVDFGDKTTINFTTSQLVWIFRGYKFLDSSNLSDDERETTGPKFVAQQVTKKKQTGAPVREGDLLADITHHLRDMQAYGWSINKK